MNDRGWTGACRFLLAGLFLFAQAGILHADSARDDVARMVQLLGYGGAIHNFKNYVLRGDHRDEYGKEAQAQFDGVQLLIKRLKANSELTGQDRQALVGIEKTISEYGAGLNRIQELIEKGWRLEDIDRAVIVDDGPALLGLKQLRARWQWSDWEQVEYHLGYGGAIHNFKNYVLRANDIYFTQALENFLAVESLLSEISSRPGLSEQHRSDLAVIERVSHAYMEYLPLVERLIRAQRPVRQIDLAVKVNDRPALAALKNLRLK